MSIHTIGEGSSPGTKPAARTILLVDDESQVRAVLRRTLETRGHEIIEASGVTLAMEVLDSQIVHLLLCDINLEDGNGLELVAKLGPRIPDLAVVMVTSSSDVSIAVEALTCGAYGYVIKPFRMDEILIQVDNALRRRDLEIAYRDREATLQQRVRQATGALRKTQEEVVFRLVAAAGYRDNETGAHIRRIGLYSAQLARLLYWNQDLVDTIRLAAPMHDVGKIGIPDRILQKPGKLDPDEWSVMQTHSALGEELLKGSDIPSLMMASRIARSHHERWNGTGYPDQLAGEGIPVEARIVGLVDVYDALTHARCYKPAWPEEKALALIEEEAGQHFDPTLAQLFIDHHREIQSIRLSLEDDLQHSTGRPASP